MSPIAWRSRQNPAASGQLPHRPVGTDLEFLPAALEILETPPSPVRMGLILIICGLATAALIWAFVGRIDILAVAQGKIQSSGRVKLVQTVETGKVQSLRVENGSHVTAGDIVVVLDDGETRAEEAALDAVVAAVRAEILRRTVAVDAVRTGTLSVASMDWPDDIPVNVRAREERVLRGDLAQLSATLASLQAQGDQKRAEKALLVATIESQEQLLAIGDQRVQLRATLEKAKLGTKLTLLDAQESLQQQRTSLAQQKGQLAEALAAIAVLERDATKATSSFIAENGQKLAEAERQSAESSQRLAKARERSKHMNLRAPVSGTVQGLTITSIGQVVMTGEELMRIVPDAGGFEIESYMPNKDIGFVHEGQEAVIKIESFPFTRYGSLSAKVVRVGKDAVAEPDLALLEANPEKSQKSTLLGGAQRTQNLYFPITLAPSRQTIGEDGSIPISNGLAVTVEIKTGERRIIDYLFSPIVELGSRALKER
jgi:hemolysin D